MTTINNNCIPEAAARWEDTISMAIRIKHYVRHTRISL